MRWEMEIEEVEAVLEKIWDLHDKLSDAIHAISRSHFLNSIKPRRKSDDIFYARVDNKDKIKARSEGDDEPCGYVFIKDFRFEDDRAIAEAKSLNAIRTALENLEDQLEFFHSVQSQQQAERDAAIARLEQSRLILAMRLADHHGKKYKVLEEAQAFIGDVHNASRFIAPEHLFEAPRSQSVHNSENHDGKSSNFLMQVFRIGINFAKKSLNVHQMGGVIGNVTLIALSMVAILQLHQMALGNDFVLVKNERNDNAKSEGSSSGHMKLLDVLSARG
ncbi:plastid division protein PDV1-like [Aristolochia californica]|uniref:plastid division protein PDV1-like n=1 Tax=Aristolochia californica TaxID=171875 RepID=UPI0035DB9A85